MFTLTVTAKGQVTFKKELLNHLGIAPGQKLEVNPLPGGQLSVTAAKSGSNVGDAFGVLSKKNATKTVLSIEDIDALTQKAWADKK